MKFNGKIDLKKFKNAFAANIKGKAATKQCVCIPIEDNYLFVGEKGIYFDFVCREISEDKRRDATTHIIAPSVPKEVYDAMTDEQKKSLPILGNLSEFQEPKMAITETVEVEQNETPDGELPF